MVLDAVKPHSHREILTRELNVVGIRLNRDPPQIYLRKKKTGGIGFNSTVPLTHMDEKMVYRIMQEYKMHNADVLCAFAAAVASPGSKRRTFLVLSGPAPHGLPCPVRRAP